MINQIIPSVLLRPLKLAVQFIPLIFLSFIWLASQKVLAMTFEKQERCINAAKPHCQKVIMAVGQIDQQTPEQFKEIAKDFPAGSWVALSSPGGSVVGALQLGKKIREAGFNTTIGSTDYSPPNCLSSCAYAFVGGMQRSIPDGSKYGIHQFRGTDKALSEDATQKISATLGAYLDVMGIDRRLLDYAQVTTSDRVNVLSLTQARLLKVDNAGQSPYPRWRLEATPEGRLLALNNLPSLSGKLPVTLALLEAPSADKIPSNKKIIFLIFYKSDDESLFKQNIEPQITTSQKIYTLKQIDAWQRKTNGYQASFSMPDEMLIALTQAPEESTITLISSISTVRFGVGGLRNIYQTFSNSENKRIEKQ